MGRPASRQVRAGRGGGGTALRPGFSLIELLVVMAISALLAILALPNFEAQLQRARRTDLLVMAVQVQAAQERYRSHAPTYGSLAEIGIAEISSSGHYRLQIPAHDARGFELLALAVGPQARDRTCRYMQLRWGDLTLMHASGPDPSLANPEPANKRCWGL